MLYQARREVGDQAAVLAPKEGRKLAPQEVPTVDEDHGQEGRLPRRVAVPAKDIGAFVWRHSESRLETKSGDRAPARGPGSPRACMP